MKRHYYLELIKKRFEVNPICALLGPRQVGKTTLARQFIAEQFQQNVEFFDLENPLDVARLTNPMLTISAITEPLIVIDEIQRTPELFQVLRVLVDRPGNTQKFLILGSASRDLLQQSSETLAGRISYIELPPFYLSEVDDYKKLVLRGGFPRSYLADTQENSFQWRIDYISTFLERDIPQLGFSIPTNQMRRFWMMLAHYHGQILNAAQLATSLTLSSPTIKKYIDILVGTFMVRLLQPWSENIKKRQVKSPKLYLRDSGIMLALLHITDQKQLNHMPQLGAIWEGFALEQLIDTLHLTSDELFFWATQSGAELDLFVIKNGKRIGFEIKYTDKPSITKSMKIAQEDLKLDHLFVIYPGDKLFPLDTNITACGIEKIANLKPF